MFLTNDEERVYNGESGDGPQYAMRLLVTLGEAFAADMFAPITKAHWSMSGMEGDLYFAERLASGGAVARVPTSTNPCWDESLIGLLRITPKDYDLELLRRTADACDKMGVLQTYSCTPYLSDNVPQKDEHIAFSESSAALYVNSVMGARTNRESSCSALAAGVLGKTPRYGMHLDENRRASVLVDVRAKIDDDFKMGLLGWYLGEIIETGSVPALTGSLTNISTEGLRDFCATLNTSNALSMFHVVGFTPEAPNLEAVTGGVRHIQKVEIDEEDMASMAARLSEKRGKINSVFVGCPHATPREINQIHEYLKGRKVHPDVKFLVFASRPTRQGLAKSGELEKLEKLGVTVTMDSCVDQPIFSFAEGGLGLTNSPKAAYYRMRRNQEFSIVDLKTIVESAVRGEIA